MNPTPREAAAEKLRIRAERLRAIRRRVWATSLATFAIAFGVIGVSGSMGTQTTTLAQGSNSTATTSSSTSDTGTSAASSDDGSSSLPTTTNGSSSSASAGTPMTTRQS